MDNKIQRESLGKVLVEVGVITGDQLKRAIAEAGGNERSLPEILIKLEFASESQIIKAIGIKGQIPYFDNLEGLVEKASAEIIPEEMSRKYKAIPLFKQGGSLLLAMANPYDINAIDDLTRYTGLNIEPVVSTMKTIFSAITDLYQNKKSGFGGSQIEIETFGNGSGANRNIKNSTEEDRLPSVEQSLLITDYMDENKGLSDKTENNSPAIDMVDRIFDEAIERKASDIHIEPKSDVLIVRYRMDGMLHEIMKMPVIMAPAITSRIKIMARLDIADTRKPQDGRIQYKLEGRDMQVDMRVSTIPTVKGEKTVIRILDRNNMILDLNQLGFPETLLEEFYEIIKHPYGILLVTGPTGSGKTTTLYAALHAIMDETKNISTLEDPVEYQIDGLNQIQVNTKINLTFASGLRSLLRQDPDILLVGEIRDRETAQIAIQAALTGHMVFTTLHTNDACGAISRMIDMGVEPFLLNSALVGVLAQRLVRLLCEDCKAPYKPSDLLLEKLGLPAAAGDYMFFQPAGCKKCHGTGYKGRKAIYEILPLNTEVRQKILEMNSDSDIYKIARKAGFKKMLEYSHENIINGLTSAEEVFRVVSGS